MIRTFLFGFYTRFTAFGSTVYRFCRPQDVVAWGSFVSTTVTAGFWIKRTTLFSTVGCGWWACNSQVIALLFITALDSTHCRMEGDVFKQTFQPWFPCSANAIKIKTCSRRIQRGFERYLCYFMRHKCRVIFNRITAERLLPDVIRCPVLCWG